MYSRYVAPSSVKMQTLYNQLRLCSQLTSWITLWQVFNLLEWGWIDVEHLLSFHDDEHDVYLPWIIVRFAWHLEDIEVHASSVFPIRPTEDVVPNICCHANHHLSAEGLKYSSDINGNQDKKNVPVIVEMDQPTVEECWACDSCTGNVESTGHQIQRNHDKVHRLFCTATTSPGFSQTVWRLWSKTKDLVFLHLELICLLWDL